MKKTMILIFLLAVAYASGQDKKEYKNQMRFSIGHFFENSLYFNCEMLLKNNNSFLLGAGPVYSEISGESKSGYRSEVQYKLYITSKEGKNSIIRIYVAPYLTYKYLENRSEYTVWSNNTYIAAIAKNYFHSFCPGIIAGWNIIAYHRLVFDFYIGGGMKRTFDGDFVGKINYDNNNIFAPGYNGVIPRFGFEMGFTF